MIHQFLAPAHSRFFSKYANVNCTKHVATMQANIDDFISSAAPPSQSVVCLL